MSRIVGVSVEHDGQAVFGTSITPPASNEAQAITRALVIVRHEIETSPGKVTRVWFEYEDDEDA